MKKILKELRVKHYKNWSIPVKYFVGQITTVVFALLISYLPLTILVRNLLENTIGEVMEQASNTASASIQHSLEFWTETWIIHASNPINHQALRESNETWDSITDRNTLIEQRDSQWTSNQVQNNRIYPTWINEVLNSDVSKEYIRIIGAYNKERGYQDIGEVILTNKYGVNIATTGLTTDYYQADETWWQEAVENNIYVSDLVYDTSLGADSIEIGVRIENNSGQLLGVVKVVLKADFLFDHVDSLMVSMVDRARLWCGDCEGLNVRFYDGNKNVIYKLKDPKDTPERELEIVDKFLTEEIEASNERYMLSKENDPSLKDDRVVLFMKRDCNCGLDGVSVFEYNRPETFAQVHKVEITILLTLMGIIVVASIYSYATVKKVTSPILELTNVADSFGKGNKDIRFSIDSDDEIGKLGDTFNKMVESVVEADRTKTEFLSIASHQLRTPLGIMGWNLEMLKTGDLGKLSNQMEHALDDVIEKNNYLKNVVNDLLSASRIEQGRITNETVNANIFKLTKKIIQDWRLEIAERNIEIIQSLDENLTNVTIDTEKYEQILDNLMSNSVKYNGENAKIWIDLKKEGENFNLTVRDDGIGIPEKDLDQVSDRFFRASNAPTTKTEGTGLGLYIIKKYTHVMGGKFSIESKLNEGTTVRIQLPINSDV